LPGKPKYRSPLGWLNDQPYLLLSLTSLFWAGNIVLARRVAGHVPPLTLSCLRWAGVFLILLPFAYPHLKRDWAVLRAHLPLMLLLTATGFAFNNAISYWAMQYTQALNALLIQSAGPLFVALMPRRPMVHQLSLIAFTTGCGAMLLLPFSIWEASSRLAPKADLLTAATLAYVVIFPSTLAYLFFNRGIALIGPNRTAPFLHLVPVFGSAMAILLLGEELRLFHLTGYALVLAGVVIASRQGSAKA